jgi:hypothetical protein
MDGDLKLEPDLDRQAAAAAARACLANELSWYEFLDRFSESDDELISDLVDLIEHEPKRGGFLGVNEQAWADYQSQVTAAIDALDS